MMVIISDTEDGDDYYSFYHLYAGYLQICTWNQPHLKAGAN